MNEEQNNITTRLDKMAAWATGINEQLKALQSKIMPPTIEQCDRVFQELADLYEQYANIRSTMQDSDTNQADLARRIAAYSDDIAAIEAQALLDVSCEIDEAGKQKFPNDTMRKAAMTIRLRENSKYVAVLNSKRNLETEAAIAKATRTSLDNALSEYRNRTRALTAILDNLTARINANQKGDN